MPMVPINKISIILKLLAEKINLKLDFSRF